MSKMSDLDPFLEKVELGIIKAVIGLALFAVALGSLSLIYAVLRSCIIAVL